MICHGSVGIGSDLIGSFVDFDPYCAQVLQLLHISKTACLIPGQNRFQLHHAVHNVSKKPLGLFWQFRPSTGDYNDTLYYNLERKSIGLDEQRKRTKAPKTSRLKVVKKCRP